MSGDKRFCSVCTDERNQDLADAEAAYAEAQAANGEGGNYIYDTIDKTRNAVIYARDEFDGLAESATELDEEIAALEETTGGLIEVMSEGATVAGEQRKQLDSVTDEIQALTDAYDAAYEAAYKSIGGQFGLFEKLSVDVETGVGDMISALESQISYMDTYAANMARAAEMGVDEGLLATLSDGSVESAAYLQAIVDAGEEKIAELNEQFSKVEEGKKEFAEQMAEMETGFSENMDVLEKRLSEATDELNCQLQIDVSGENMMNHRLCRGIMYGNIMAGIILAGIPLLIPKLRHNQTVFLASGASLSTIGIAFGLIFLRCTYCGKLLPLRGFPPDYCHHCSRKPDSL